MGGVLPQTCWASYKYGIKSWYTVASCWIFFMNCTMMHGSTNITLSYFNVISVTPAVCGSAILCGSCRDEFWSVMPVAWQLLGGRYWSWLWSGHPLVLLWSFSVLSYLAWASGNLCLLWGKRYAWAIWTIFSIVLPPYNRNKHLICKSRRKTSCHILARETWHLIVPIVNKLKSNVCLLLP
jgi:hypothetical protein